jgi:hypothetical protein
VTTIDSSVAAIITTDSTDPGGASYNGLPLDGPLDPGNYLSGEVTFQRQNNASNNIVVHCRLIPADIDREVCLEGDANLSANATSVTIASGTGTISGSIHLFGMTR